MQHGNVNVKRKENVLPVLRFDSGLSSPHFNHCTVLVPDQYLNSKIYFSSVNAIPLAPDPLSAIRSSKVSLTFPKPHAETTTNKTHII